MDGRSSPASAAKAARIDLKERDANMEANLEPKNELIACCGLDCEKCDARIATLANDNALREKTAALWTKLNGVTITPEMINCTGCRMEGARNRMNNSSSGRVKFRINVSGRPAVSSFVVVAIISDPR